MKIEKGMVLVTKNGQQFSNAIIVDVDLENKRCTILTDFGNMLFWEIKKVQKYFDICENWKEHKFFEFPFPTIQERIEQQIKLLTKVQNMLRE